MASSLETVTFEGVPEGSCMALPPHEIPDTCARYLQDSLVDELGLVRSRGPLNAAAGVPSIGTAAIGILQTMTPANVHKVAILTADGNFWAYSDDYTTKASIGGAWTTWHSSPYTMVDAKAAVGGGALIGVLDEYGQTPYSLAYWRGSDMPAYSTGTVTCSRGSKTVTGVGTAWASNLKPGMFFKATADDAAVSTYIGEVASVDSDTQVTLVNPALFPATAAAYLMVSRRGIVPHYRGRLTTDTATTVVAGSSTQFVANVTGGSGYVFRASDYAYIGKVTTVNNDTTLTLAANALIKVEVEDCIIVKPTDISGPVILGAPVGPLNAVYAERQWFAHGDTLRFSEPNDFEAHDFDPISGNFVPVTSTKIGAASRPITGIAPAWNSLLVTKENEAFTLIGSSPGQFELRKLQDDGALCHGSIQVYDGSVIFAGREGIYSFDGQQVNNLVEDRLGDYYKSLVRQFDPTTHRMWSMVSRDHYLVFIESVTAKYGPTKGNVVDYPLVMTIAIYLPTRAVTFMTNLDIRGSIELPASTGKGVWFIVNTASGVSICPANDLFESNGQDALVCSGNSAGPDWYIESKRYGLGDDLRKKLFKQLTLEYFAGGDDIVLDTAVGLNDNGTTSLSPFAKTLLAWTDVPPVGTNWDSLATQYVSWDDLGQPRFKVARVKFLKRTQQLGFRLYQKSPAVTQIKLGPWSLAFKLQRPGRI